MTDDELRKWADDTHAKFRAEVAAREPGWQAERAAIIAEADRVLAAFRASLNGTQS